MVIDVKALGKVAVLMGGWSREREVSLMSGQGVLEALQTQGVDAHAFDPKVQNLEELKQQGFARCFIALHGQYGEDGAIQGALEILKMPYTGSGVMASAMSMDKVMTKRLWIASGLPTPAYRVVLAHEASASWLNDVVNVVGFPMIVKPAKEGSSIGVYKVNNEAELQKAIEEVAYLGHEIMCEQFIDGEELTCPVIGTGSSAVTLPLIRIVAPQGNYDYEHKYFANDTRYDCPAPLSQDETASLQSMVLKAYNVLNCRGWGRIDVMRDRVTHQPYLLEMNTSPGMTSHSLVPMAARAVGISYGELCVQLVAAATLDSNMDKGV